MMIITKILANNLITVNFHPIEETSNNSSGILILLLEHIKIKIFEILPPLFSNIPATGSKAYNGTAVTDPRRIEIQIPRIPDFLPIILIIISFSTQTSSKPIQIKTGVNIIMKFVKYFTVNPNDFIPD